MLGAKFKDLDSREWEWNGFGLINSSGLDFILCQQEPTAEQAEMLLRGWSAGYMSGKNIGRSILQNEFRNLMRIA